MGKFDDDAFTRNLNSQAVIPLNGRRAEIVMFQICVKHAFWVKKL